MEWETPSPDGNHTARLTYEGEIRFGPAWHKLALDSMEIEGRLFGQTLLWSPDSRYLATAEWLETGYGTKPVELCVTLFDVKNRLSRSLSKAENMFMEQFRFTPEGLFSYAKHDYAAGKLYRYEVAVADFKDGWAAF